MNERIQELEAQCWEERKYGPPWFNSTKFAELLIRECIEAIQGESMGCKDEWELGLIFAENAIKEHFRVEE